MIAFADRARTTIRAILEGAAPNGVAPESCGPWGEVVELLYAAHATGGTAAVRRQFDALSRVSQDLARLIAGGDHPYPVPREHDHTAMPPLAITLTEPTTGAAWLDSYIAYSRQWSPRSFDDYHEAVGLWLLSAVAARRVVAHLGKPRYTPLCIALAARSSLYAKTTAAQVGIDLLRTAGLDWLITANNVTPQKFIQERTQRVTDTFGQLPLEAQATIRRKLAFAGQRGWWYDEFGMLVSSMARSGSTMADFSGLLRRFDECEEVYEHGTIGRGDDAVVKPYVALLAALTPADLRPVMRRGSAGWTNGLWPRWAFVCPPEGTYKTDRFPEGARSTPPALIRHMRDWHDALGTPGVTLTTTDQRTLVEVGPLPQHAVQVTAEVRDAYYGYNDALLAIVAESSVQELDSWYARLHDRVLRVALLLASVDGAAQIRLDHWARAQAVGERWRASMHRLYHQVNDQQEATSEATAEEAIMTIITRLGNPTARDIKTRIAWLSRGEIQEHLDRLSGTRAVLAVPTSQSVRYTLSATAKGEDEEGE